MESIYKDNQKSSKTSTNTSASESTTYLKKSELPKNVSSFKNDAGYISSSSLESWLQNHSYISKDEIQELISAANITVLNTVQDTDDRAAIQRLDDYDNQLRGEIVEIKDKLEEAGIDKGFITKDKEDTFTTKTELSNVLTGYATKSELNTVKNLIPSTDDFVTVEELNSRNYLTEHQSLEEYAKKSEIPTLTGYVKKSELDDTLTNYALNENVFTKTEISSITDQLLSKSDASSTYLKKDDAVSTYLKIEDYTPVTLRWKVIS